LEQLSFGQRMRPDVIVEQCFENFGFEMHGDCICWYQYGKIASKFPEATKLNATISRLRCRRW
jgi:predicted hydrocarbon binding protein